MPGLGERRKAPRFSALRVLWSMVDVVRLIEEREDLRSGAVLVG
jgi:hypothetical protein